MIESGGIDSALLPEDEKLDGKWKIVSKTGSAVQNSEPENVGVQTEEEEPVAVPTAIPSSPPPASGTLDGKWKIVGAAKADSTKNAMLKPAGKAVVEKAVTEARTQQPDKNKLPAVPKEIADFKPDPEAERMIGEGDIAANTGLYAFMRSRTNDYYGSVDAVGKLEKEIDEKAVQFESTYKQQAEVLKQQISAESSKIEAEFAEKQQKAKEKYESSVKTAETEKEKKLITDSYNSEIQTIQAGYEAKVNGLNANIQKQAEKIDTDYASSIEKLNTEAQGWDYGKEKEANKVLIPDQVKAIKEEIKGMPKDYEGRKKALNRYVNSILDSYDGTEQYDQVKEELYGIIRDEVLFDKDNQPTPYALKNQAEIEKRSVAKEFSKLKQEYEQITSGLRQKAMLSSQGMQMYDMMLEKIPGAKEKQQRLSYLERAVENYDRISQLPESYLGGEKTGSYFEGMAGVKNVVTNALTAGLISALESEEMLKLAQKQKHGQPLTKDEQRFLDSVVLLETTTKIMNPGFTNWYKAGRSTAESLPWITNMMATGGAYNAGKLAAMRVLKSTGYRAGKKWTAKAIGKTVAAEAVGSAARIPFQPSLVENVVEGIVEPKATWGTKGLEGQVKETGRTAAGAIGRAVYMQWAENFSEISGTYISAAGKKLLALGAAKAGIKTFSAPKIAKVFGGMRGKFSDVTKISSIPAEYAEEVMANALHLVDGTTTFESMTDFEENWVTFLSVATMVGGMQVASGTLKGIGSTISGEELAEGIAEYFSPEQVIEIDKISALGDLTQKASALSDFIQQNKVAGADPLQELARYVWDGQVQAGATAAASPEPGLPDTLPKYTVGEKPSDEETVKELIGDAKTPDQLAGIKIENNPEMELELSTKFKTLQENEKFTAALEGVTDQGEIDKITEAHTVALEKIDEEREAGLAKIVEKTQTVKPKPVEKLAKTEEKGAEPQQVEEKEVAKSEQKKTTVKPAEPSFQAMREELGVTDTKVQESMEGDVFSGRVKFVDVVLAAGKKTGEVVIESMRTPKLFRKMGRATKALAKITEAADKQGITLKLIAKPEEKSGVTEEQLVNFYKKNGFKFKEGSNEGVRAPWDPNIKVSEEVKKKFESLTANAEGALPWKWVPSQENLPKSIVDKAMSENSRLKRRGSIDGVYDPKTGKVYLVADQIKTKDDVARVWLHEQVGHHGIDLVYPNKKDRDAFHEEVFRSVGIDKIRKVVSPSEMRIFEGSDKGAKARIRLADEYVAYLTNKVINKEKLTVEEKSAWQKILDIVRKAWAKLYGKAPVNTLSDDDIARVLNKALAEVYKKKGVQDAKEDGRGPEKGGKKEGIDGGKEERLHIRDDERGGLEAEKGEKIRFSFQEKFPLFETLSKKGRLYGYNRKQVVRYLRDNVNDFKDVKTAQRILNIPDSHPAVRILEQAFSPSPEIYTMPTDVSSRLTTDENGDYVFHHYRSVRREKIDPKMSGKRPDTFTNSQEIGAMGDVGGENFYYTEEGQREAQAGKVLHTITVPKERVYFINEDFFDFLPEARRRHEELHGKDGIEFSPNHQVAQITKIAQEHGFDMTVSEWEGSGLRGQSVTEKVPQEKDTPLKEQQVQFKVGMLVDDGNRTGKITEVDSKWVSYEAELYPGQMFQYDIPTWKAAKTLRIVSVADTEARGLPFELTTEIRSDYKVKYNWLKRALMNSGMGEFEANRLIVERVSARLTKELPEILKQEGHSGKVGLVPSIGGYNGETGYEINPNIRLSFEDIEDDLLLSLMFGLNLAGFQRGANAFRSPTKKELSEGDKGIHGMLTFVKPFRLDQDGFIEMMTELAGILDENGDAPFAGFTDFGEFVGMAGHFYENGGGDFHKEYEKNEGRIESILDEYGVEKGSIAFVYKKIFDYDENFSGRSRQTVRTVTQKIRDERGDNSQTERIFRQASDIFASELKSIGDGVGRNKGRRTGRQGLESDEAIRFSVLTLPEKNATAIRGNPAFISNAFEHLKANKFPTNYDFKLWSQKEFKKHLPILRKVYGKELTPGVFNKAMADYMSDQLLVEARLALTEHPKAVGWYDEQTKRCISIMGEIYPELLSDIDSQTAFITALAITSNGNKVRANLSYADRQYQSFKNTGRFDAEMEMGDSQSAIRETLKIINGILDDGITITQIREFFLTKYRVGDLKYTKVNKGKSTKESLVNKRLVDDQVYGAVVIGPKVGNGFWMNLFGEFSQLTIDRWGMATFGRVAGRSVIVDKEKTASSYQEAVEALSGIKSNPKARAAMESIIGSIKGMTDKNIINAYYKASVKKDNRDQMKAFHQLERMRLKTNGYFKYLYNSILAPKNGTEWRFFEKVFGNVISRLRNEGIKLTVADTQALFWYQEKVLFDYSKSKKDLSEIKKEYEEDAAPNFGNAASDLARSRGVDSGRIEQARDNADRVREFQRRATGVDFEGVSEDDKAKLVEAIGRFKQISKTEEEDEGEPRLSIAPETVIAKAKDYFGVTTNFKEVGYITPDGAMLDFSGKKFGGKAGKRTMDHRDVSEIGSEMGEFMAMGNIRIMSKYGIDIAKAPTMEQKRAITKYINSNLYEGTVYVDFSTIKGTIFGVEYNNAKASKILGDIDNYYLKGIKPQSSPKFAADIRFSQPKYVFDTIRRKKNKVYSKVLDVTEAGPFDGGCVYFARALQRVVGGEVVSLISSKTNEPTHAAVLRNGKLIDFDGERGIPEFYKTFAENEGDKVSSHRAFKEGDLPDAPRGTEGEVNELAAMITPSMGNIRFSRVNDLLPEPKKMIGGVAYETAEGDEIRFKATLEREPKRFGIKVKPEKNVFTNMERQIEENKFMNLMGPQSIESFADIAFLFRHLETASSENAFLVMEKEDGTYNVLYVGTGNTVGVVTDPVLMATAAKEFGAVGVTFVHNHPSGNLHPSDADQNMHEVLVNAFKGICDVHMSVIIDLDRGFYTTFTNRSMPYKHEPTAHEGKKADTRVKVYSFDKQKLYSKSETWDKITGSNDVAAVLSKIKRGIGDKFIVLIVNRANAITRAYLSPKIPSQQELVYMVGKHGNDVILGTTESMAIAPKIRELKVDLNKAGINLIDCLQVEQDPAISKAYKSYMNHGIMEPPAEYSIEEAEARFSEPTEAESLIQQSLRRLVKGDLITKGERATLVDKLKDFIAAAPTTKKPQELADEAYAFLNELLKIKFLKRQEKELEAGFKGKMKEQKERQKMIAKNLKELSSIITQALGNIRRDEKQMITPGQYRAIINRLGNADTVRKMQALLDYVFDTVILGKGAKYKAELAIAKKWQGKIGDKNGGEKSQFGSAREIADRVENIDLKELSYEELQEFSEIASGMFLSQRNPSIAHLRLLDHRFGDTQKVKKEKEEPTPESATEIIEAVGKMDTQDIVDIPSYLTFRRKLNSFAKKIKELFADMNPDLAQELEEQYELEIDGIEEMVNKQLEAFRDDLENFRKAHAVHLARRLKQKETRDGTELLETQEERDAANELIDTQTKDIMDLDINLLAELETAINNLREGHITPAFFDIKRAVRISHKKRLTFLPGFDIVGKDKTGIWARRRKKGGRRGVQTLVPKSLRKNDLFKELVRQFKSKQPFRMGTFIGVFEDVKNPAKAFTETGRAITLAETDKQKFDKAAGIAYQEFQKGKSAKEQERWRKWIFLYKAMIRWQNSKYAEKNPNLFHMVFDKLYEVERTKVDDPTGFDEDAAYYKTFMDFMREKGGLTAPDAEGLETLNETEADRVMREDAGVAALLDWSDKIVEQYKGMNKVSALYNGRSLIWGDFYVPFMRKYKNDNLESESNIESWINRLMFNANFVAGSTYEWSGNPMYMEMDIMRVMSLYSEMMRRNYFIYPELRENVTALKEAARAVSREIIEKNADRKDNDIYLLGRALAESLRSRISSYYNSNYMMDQSVILKKAEVAIKKTMLVKIEKFLSEFSVNISRIMLATMNIPAADLERLVKKYDFWGNEINSWVNKGMWSAYSTEINYKLIGSVLGSGWARRTAKGAEQVADWMIKAPDMGAGRILFVHSMTRKFKELTGEEFDEDKWKESRSYRQKWSDAKEESMYFANTRVEELFNSKNPLSEGELKSFLGGLLKADRRNAMARSFSMLMSFGQNDSNQIADSFRRIRHGGPKARLRAIRDINALFTSNFMYAVVRAWTGVMAYQYMYKPIFDSISDTLIASVATPGGGDDEWEKVMEEIEAKDEEYMDKKANVFKKGDYYLDLLKFRIGPDFLLGGSSNIVEYGGKWLVWAYDRTYGLSDDTRQAISDAFYQRYIMLIPHTWNDPEKTLLRAIPPMWETAFEDALSFAHSLSDFTRGHIATSIIGAVFDVEDSGEMTKKEAYDLLNLWFTASKYLMFFHPLIPIAEREIRKELRGLNKAAREMKKAQKSSGTQDASEPVVVKPVGF